MACAWLLLLLHLSVLDIVFFAATLVYQLVAVGGLHSARSGRHIGHSVDHVSWWIDMKGGCARRGGAGAAGWWVEGGGLDRSSQPAALAVYLGV